MVNNPPKHLSRSSKQLWRDLTTEYSLDDAAGLRILRSALESLDRAEAAREAIARDGLLIKDRWGQDKVNPLCAVERDARSSFLHAMKALSLDLEPLRSGPGRPPDSERKTGR
jgi:phage terminase small subunit